MNKVNSRNIEEFDCFYDLEIEEIINDINKKDKKLVLLQFPDGLKRFSKQVVDNLKKHTKANYFIYFGTCYGGCDIPLYLESLGFDLCIQFGHCNYIKKEDMW